MGYTTDFKGSFQFNKQLSPKMQEFLSKFNETRRMSRNVDSAFGTEGEFYVFGGGSFGQGHEDNIINYNDSPKTQPSLWCQWVPTEDGLELHWDGGEKFYYYNEWLYYLVYKIIAPNGYILNGTVQWSGEEVGDNGTIEVRDNVIYINGAKMTRVEAYKKGVDFMELENVLILDNLEKLLTE